MEQNRERKFVCRFCKKRYPCGKSLGGHIRTHMNNNENSAEAEEGVTEISINKLVLSRNGRNIKRAAEAEAEAEAGGQSRYGLRENPKKTKKFSDSVNDSVLKEMICKECGKGFQSLKALCGHMACHSEKERAFHKFEDQLIMDSQSDTETSSPSRERRSKSIRFKTIGVYSKNSVSLAETEEEQEEVARCLMMLSRDSGCKKGLNSVADSSDNNSVVLEAKSSSSIDLKFVCNHGELVKMKKPNNIKLKSAESGPFSGNSDLRSSKNDCYSPEFLCNKSSKGSKYKCLACNKAFSSHRALGGHRASHTKVNDCSESIHESGEDSLANDSFAVPLIDSKVTKFSHGNAEKRLGSKKKKGHECPFCFRVFKSGQALGGHKRSHFVAGSENRTLVSKQDSPEIPGLIDLNLPAPVEEDASGKAGFMPW